MKYLISVISASLLSLAWLSCERVETDPEALDYYKNKDISVSLTSEDFNEGDHLHVKISAVAIGDKGKPAPGILLNGKPVEGGYAEITSELLLDGPVTISAGDKAWQMVAEYTVSADATPYTLIWSSTFDNVAQKPLKQEVKSSSPESGIIEIKEYK